MEPQQPNHSEKAPNDYTKLNDEETNPSIQPSSRDKEELQESLSNIHQRTFISGQEGPNSRPESDPQNQIKELSSCFSNFYKVMLVFFMWGSVVNIRSMIFSGIDGFGFDKFEVFCDGWKFVQCVIAFDGVRKRNLGKISNAFFMMKMYYLLLGITLLYGGLEAKIAERKQEDRLSRVVIVSILHTIMLFLPTWRVKRIFKTLPEVDSDANKEEIRKEQPQETDPIERLGSLWFTIYKYGLLLLFCVQVKNFVSGALEDFSDASKFLEKLMSRPGFFVSTVGFYSITPFRGVFMFLIFEGIRRKNLEKVLAAIKLMKVVIIGELALKAVREVALSYEGKKFMEEDVKNFEGLDIDSDWFLPLVFGSKFLMIGVAYYFMYLFGALKARNVLKAHQEVKRTL